jgi:hypothetical protein
MRRGDDVALVRQLAGQVCRRVGSSFNWVGLIDISCHKGAVGWVR